MNSWFEINHPEEILTPALLFYPVRIKLNIDKMIRMAGTADRLRPHVKTYKCREIIKMQLTAGITKFKCATLTEAELLASSGVTDILIGYPLIGPAQKQFIKLTLSYPNVRFSVLVDHIEQLESWKKNAGQPIRVFIDLDVGMHRTGINPDQAFDLFTSIREADFTFSGLHVYDGHIHTKDPEERKKVVEKGFEKVDQLMQKIKASGMREFEVVCGGSITFPVHAQYPGRMLSPGTTLLWDQGYSHNFPDLPFEIAAVLLTRVISKPEKNLLCLDLGHKAVASEMKAAPVFFPQLPDANILIHSEEHLVLETPRAVEFHIGDELYGFPWHICPTVALHEKALIIENKNVSTPWEIIARKRNYQL